MVIFAVIVGVVVLGLGIFALALLRATSWAEQSWLDNGRAEPDHDHLRGRLIASEERFKRQTDWQRPAAKGVNRNGAA